MPKIKSKKELKNKRLQQSCKQQTKDKEKIKTQSDKQVLEHQNDAKSKINLTDRKTKIKNHQHHPCQSHPSQIQIRTFTLTQKKIDRHLLSNPSILPQLQKNQNTQSDPAKTKKRISISTYIHMNSPLVKENPSTEQRNQVLSTQKLKQEEELLAVLFNQSSLKENSPDAIISQDPFQIYAKTFTGEYPEKLIAQMNLLEKKKMLKNLKQDMEKKKTQLFLEMLNQRQIKKQEKLLQKKYNPQVKQAFKLSRCRSTQANELLLMYSQHRSKLAELRDGNKPFRNSLEYCVEVENQADEEEQQKKPRLSIVEPKQIMKLKQFIDFFKGDDHHSKRLKIEEYQKSRNQKSSKYLHHKESLSQNIESPYDQIQQSNPLGQNIKSLNSTTQRPKFRQRHGFINKSVHFGMEEKKQSDQENAHLANAKLRMKANHKKLVNLGKVPKNSSMGKILQCL